MKRIAIGALGMYVYQKLIKEGKAVHHQKKQERKCQMRKKDEWLKKKKSITNQFGNMKMAN